MGEGAFAVSCHKAFSQSPSHFWGFQSHDIANHGNSRLTANITLMYYTHEYIIPNFLCDQHDTLTMWGVARLFQEVAGFHVSSVGMGFPQLIEQGRAWVLCRAFYQVNRLPHEGDKILLKTWSRGTDGLFAFREFQMFDSQGGILVSSSAYWAIIDVSTRRVMRIQDMMGTFESHPDFATERQTLPRLRTPKGVPFEQVAQFSVRPSMLDHTGHVNNAEYVKWIFDYLPDADYKSAPFAFSIEYLLETQPSEAVSLSRLTTPPSTLFQISNSRSIAVIASLS